jgi:methyl-accepting chemotaxis protein
MSDSEELIALATRLEAMEQEALSVRERSKIIQRRTNRVIHVVFAFIGAMALVNLYFINDLSGEVKVVARSMVEMYTNFGQMSERMQRIRIHVQNMAGNVKTMPIMAQQMEGMSGYMGEMRSDVEGMSTRMESMQQHVESMNRDIFEMAVRFQNMNNSVYGLGSDVRDMSNILP